MTFGLTGGEIALVAFIFVLTYGAGQLPRLSDWLTRRASREIGNVENKGRRESPKD